MSRPQAGRKASSTVKALARTNRPIQPEVVAADVAPRIARSTPSSDGFRNVVAALGTSRDKRSANCFSIVRQLTRVELESMYRGNWIAAKIVDAIAEDATAKWVNLSWDGRDDDEGTVKSIQVAEDYFDLRGKVTEAVKWARLYGGGAIVIGIKGDDDWSKPLKLESVKKGSLEMLHVLDRWRLAATGQIDYDRKSPNFGQPTYYTIAEAAESVERVHWTRVVLFHGKRLPYFEWQRNGRWHDSVLQNLEDNVKDYEATRAGIASMVFEANVDILAVKGLYELLSMPGGEQKLIDRVQLGAMLKSMNHVWLIDGGSDGQTNGGEEYKQKTTSFSGVNDVFEKVCMFDVCGASSIPMTRMFGRSPAGLNSTGEGDAANYESYLESYQKAELLRPLNTLYQVLVRHVLGSMKDDFKVEFVPLSQVSANDKATNELKRAQRDDLYLKNGAIHEGVVARELKDDGIYRTMEDEDVEMAEELALQPEPEPVAPGAAAGKTAPAVPGKGAPAPV